MHNVTDLRIKFVAAGRECPKSKKVFLPFHLDIQIL